MVENLISLKVLLSRIKHHILSYHNHLLKIGVSLFCIGFLVKEMRQSRTLAQRKVFHLLFSTNKTKRLYFLLSFVFFIADSLLKKDKQIHEKSPLLTAPQFYIKKYLFFSNQSLAI